MERFAIRQFRPGDEAKINELYFKVTGRRRSTQEYLWQWHQSPAGSGDIWLIHDSENDGKLIGHHGVMPIRFTKGGEDLLFGKIENTMVLPDYRTKILYPRYEIRFKREYEKRYHALFATMGPDEAIRIRKALGYSFPAQWLSLTLGTSVVSELHWLSYAFAKMQHKIRGKHIVSPPIPEVTLERAGFLKSQIAREHVFFEDFWEQARQNHEIAPRRDVADLEWRFWTNPHKQHFTYVVGSQGCSGYAIVSIRDGIARLEDYAVSLPSGKNYHILFDELCEALDRAGLYLLGVTSTDDHSLIAVKDIFRNRQVLGERVLRKIRPPNNSSMPRYICPRGRSIDLGSEDWSITGVIFEGR